MLISKAEIEALKIVDAYYDTPAKMVTSAVWGELFNELLKQGFLKYNRECTCLRLTEDGAKILQRVGIKTREYKFRAAGRTMERRLQSTETAMLFSEIGANVLLNSLPKESEVVKPLYLSAAEMRRRKKENVFGMSKFIGLLYSAGITYGVYNVSSPAETFFPLTDEELFKRELIMANAPAKIMYIADCGLEKMAEAYVNTSPTETVENASPLADFYQAIELFTYPVCFVPIDACGVTQLQIMLTDNYRSKLARCMIDVDFRNPPANYLDAAFGDNEHLIVFIDFDVKRLEKAIRLAKNLNVLVLTEQENALRTLIKGYDVNVCLIEADEVFSELKIPQLENKLLRQFTTEKGDGMLAEKYYRQNN
jgi:hypothetical protein